ncbi:Ankyrin repeat-containing domain protein [Lactarius tabidus]
MSQRPAPESPSKPSTLTASSSPFKVIFEKALKGYQKKTGQDLIAHPLAAQLQKCDSPAAIRSLLQDQVDQFNKARSSDERLQRWLNPTISVLHAFSETLGGGISLVFSPAKVIFVGAGVLLQAAKEVEASQDLLIDLFERIENFFRRLEVYNTVPPTPAMTDMMVKIMVEVLDILGTITKEMKQSRAKKFLKKIAGITKLEDGLKKLDKMTNEEVRMANAESLRLSHNIDKKVEVVDEKVQGVGGQVKGVDEKVQGVNENVLSVHENVKAVANIIAESQLSEKLIKCQSPSNPSTNHNLATDLQHKGTAEWFCRGSNFETWKVTGSLLWIHGKPGSGKSILWFVVLNSCISSDLRLLRSSAIINDIETLHNAGQAFMAYFYFDFRDTGKQSRGDLLRSLLIQLSAQSDPFCEILSRLYDDHDKGTRQPSDGTLMRCLEEMLTLPDQCPIYLIMDALDECPNTFGIKSPREKVLDVVKELVDLQLSNLRICVTSRPEVNIRSALEDIAFFSVSLHDESGQQKDIVEYIKSVVHSPSDTLMKKWREEHKDLVIQALSERADGMFRWVFCQLETLRHCLPQNIPHIISQLPASLDETYERILKEIGKTNNFFARRLLQCLTMAMRPLRVKEFAQILALDFEAGEVIPELKEDWRWQDEQEAVLSTCSSLIAIIGERFDGIVQFAHFSVKEFLTSDRLATSSADISRFHILPEPAHTVLAKACLGILLRSEHKDHSQRSPLIDYAKDCWVDHARFEKVWTHVEDGIRRLFDPTKPYLKPWLKRSDLHELEHIGGYNYDRYRGSPLYYASLCGLRGLAAQLISENPQHVNGPIGLDDNFNTPLHLASQGGHFEIVQELLTRGADITAQNQNQMTPLHLAPRIMAEIVQILVDHGADVTALDMTHSTPLHLASFSGIPEIVRILLENGADVNAKNETYSTPLHRASLLGSAESIRLLLEYNADITARDSSHITPLHHASSWTNSVQLLINHGADVTAQEKTGSTPLHLSSSLGSAKVVQLLIEHGADVTAQNKTQSTPLHLASSCVSFTASSFLIHLRADVNAQKYHNILGHKERSIARTEIVRLLIEHGADVTAQDEAYSTPLHLAASEGSAETVGLLIEHGADVAAKDEGRRTPLHLASSVSVTTTVRLLIKHGANVSEQDKTNSTPLHFAAFSGSSDTVHLLLEHGADVTALDGDNKTPLHRAVSKVSTTTVEIARLLVECGADVTAQDESRSTPLHLASSFGVTEIVRLLIERGADIAARDVSHKTPLHLASSLVHVDTAKLLIDHGADVAARDETQSTPLHLASSFGNAETVRLLIEHGADPTAHDGNKRTPLHQASSRVSVEPETVD